MEESHKRPRHRVWVRGIDEPHECRSNENVLQALERDHGKKVRVGCRKGGCGACRIRVISGGFDSIKMSRAHVSEAEEEQGYVLGCRVFPTSDLVIEPAYVPPRARCKA